ncbi:MAG: PKD domain-containing protein [Methanospirillum sp.]
MTEKVRIYLACAIALIGLLAVLPAAAADPGRIAYVARPNVQGLPYVPDTDIFVMNADGTGQTYLTLDGELDCWPSWSPDGSRIAYVHEPVETAAGNSMEIYVMNADGTGQTRLTANDAVDYMPAWSPDGSRIAFVSNHAYEQAGYDYSSPCDIWVMNADGSSPTRLTTDGVGSRLAWSPDGARIAYEGSGGIWTMNADGTSPAFLIAGSQPAWSPDGSRIAFSLWADGKNGVWVANADGTGARFLVDGSYPSWSPDSSRIAFERGGIYAINTDGTGLIALATGGSAPAWAPSGSTAPTGPTATFTWTSPAVAGSPVRFAARSTGPVTAWSWTFGDRTTATIQSPVHTFARPGTYTVTLRVKGPQGWSQAVARTVTVLAAATPLAADFVATPMRGKAPLAVQFTDRSAPAPVSWQWDFNGDGRIDSTRQNPSYRYSSPGTYTVRLTVTDASGRVAKIEKANLVAVSPKR